METESFIAGGNTVIRGIDKDTADLDKILLSLEQDTKRQIQQLEKENRQTTALENRVKLAEDKIRDLEQANTKLDEDTKAVHAQFRQNRDSIEGLKKHYTVLIEHQEALSQRYQTLQDNWSEQQIDIDKSLIHYEDIWRSYKAKYESMPMAVELNKHKQEIDEINSKLQTTSDINRELKHKLHAIQYKDSSKSWKKCVVELAKLKIQTCRIDEENRQLSEENNQLNLKLKEEKEKQNMLMQEYHAKKKLHAERADQLKIAQQLHESTQQEQQLVHYQQQSIAQQLMKTKQDMETPKQQQWTQMEQMQQMERKQMTQTHMEQAQVEWTQMEQTQVERTQMERTQMEQTQVERTQVEGTQMEQTERTQVERTQMEQTLMERTQVERTQVEQTQVERTQVEQTQVERTQMEQMQMERIQMKQAQIEWTQMEQLQQINRGPQEQFENEEQQQKEMERSQEFKRIHRQQEMDNMERVQQQQKSLQSEKNKLREIAVRSTPTDISVLAEVPQVANATIHQSPSFSQISMISTPVIPSREIQHLPVSSNGQQPDKNQKLNIPQLDILSPVLGSAIRNAQRGVCQMTTVTPEQFSCSTNLNQYKPKDTRVPSRIPSQSTDTHQSNIQKEKDVPVSRSMYFQIPSLYQPPPSPQFNVTQVSSVGTPVCDNLTQAPALPTKLQIPNVQIPTQVDSTQQELAFDASSRIRKNSEAVFNRNVQSQSLLPTEGNRCAKTKELPEVANIGLSRTSGKLLESTTFESTPQEKGIKLPTDPVSSKPMTEDAREISDQDQLANTDSTYQMMVPEDGQSLFAAHKASFERNTNISPGFEFKRRPMFKTTEEGGEEDPSRNQNIGDLPKEGNACFQSFFQLGIGESVGSSEKLQQASNYGTTSQTTSLEANSTKQSQFASSGGITPSITTGIFGESSFNSPTSLFGEKESANTGAGGEQTAAGFLFQFGGEQNLSTDKQSSPGFSFMGTASPDATATKESGFSLF